MKAAYYPFSFEGNKYSKIIIECIKNSGNEVLPFERVIKNRELRNEVEIYYFNWIENIQANNKFKMLSKFLLRVLLIKYLKFKNKKIIWTMHNRTPHDIETSKIVEFFMKFLVKASDKIIILSDESKNELLNFINLKEIDNKVFYIPHPNYIGEYPVISNISDNESDSSIKLLFLGMIRRYKNIELIIDIANHFKDKNIKFIIAGKPIDYNYEKELLNKIKSNNIETIFEFIEDKKMISLINKSDALLLPYDIKSSMNSGTILLAFSNKKTVISPMIGTLKDFNNKEFYFGYEYSTYDEHKKELIKTINKITKIPKKEIECMGRECYRLVERNYNKEIITKRYIELNKSLVTNKE